MSLLGGLFGGGGEEAGEKEGADGEEEEDFEILHHGVHKKDFDLNGCVFYLLSQWQNRPLEEGEKRGPLPGALRSGGGKGHPTLTHTRVRSRCHLPLWL